MAIKEARGAIFLVGTANDWFGAIGTAVFSHSGIIKRL